MKRETIIRVDYKLAKERFDDQERMFDLLRQGMEVNPNVVCYENELIVGSGPRIYKLDWEIDGNQLITKSRVTKYDAFTNLTLTASGENCLLTFEKTGGANLFFKYEVINEYLKNVNVYLKDGNAPSYQNDTDSQEAFKIAQKNAMTSYNRLFIIYIFMLIIITILGSRAGEFAETAIVLWVVLGLTIFFYHNANDKAWSKLY